MFLTLLNFLSVSAAQEKEDSPARNARVQAKKSAIVKLAKGQEKLLPMGFVIIRLMSMRLHPFNKKSRIKRDFFTYNIYSAFRRHRGIPRPRRV